MGNQGTNLEDDQSVARRVIDVYWAWVLTAAFAMNIAYAKVPLSLGIPYCARASSLSTPPVKTSVMGYFEPSSDRSRVDMNGSDCAPQVLV